MTAQTVHQDDPYTSAMNPQERPAERHYFGQVVTVDPWFCVLQKGIGKTPFDPTRDPIAIRRTCIKIEVQPLRGDFMITQECMDFEDAWVKHTLPSLRDEKIELRDLKNKWVEVVRMPLGTTYRNKQNEIKHHTALVIVAQFPDREACQAAADRFFAQFTSGSGQRTGSGKATVEEAELPANLRGPGMDPMKKFALESLPKMWVQAGKDLAKFSEIWTTTGFVNHYPLDHPQVLFITGQAKVHDDDLPF